MTNEEMINWINNAAYQELLQKWRYEPSGSPWFTGEIGEHFSKIFNRKRSETPQEEQIQASKQTGWD